MATKKLYDQNAYDTRFQAQVLSCRDCIWKNASGEEVSVFAVELDQTLFFPEEGGQTPDKGVVKLLDEEKEIAVLDVQISKENVITHILECPILVGKKIEGKIDWQHRFFNMQQHSAEHIFSGLAYSRFGYQNVGFHLSNQIVTMDFDGVFTLEQLEEMEWAVNEAIAANVEIKTGYPTAEELSKLEYRSKKDLQGDIRIVEVEGYDLCACCAPHVKRTGEIGMFKIQYVQSYKGGVRISFLSGFRALEEYRRKSQIISDLSGILTTNQENLPEHVTKLKNQVQNLKAQLANAKQTIMESKIEDISPEQKNVLLFEQDLENLVMRNTVNKLVEKHDGLCGVFVGSEREGYSFILGSKFMDCRDVAKHLKETLNARGGGSAQMVQGSVDATEQQILGVLANL